MVTEADTSVSAPALTRWVEEAYSRTEALIADLSDEQLIADDAVELAQQRHVHEKHLYEGHAENH